MRTIRTNKIKLNPAQTLALGFASVILIGAILLTLPIATVDGSQASFLTALFTSTSAVCVTGLVVVDTGTYWSVFGQTVILLLIQIGGLGIMTMTTMFALILGKKISLKDRLLMQEALNQLSLDGLVRLTKYILIGTFLVEGIGAFVLSFRFIPIYGFLKGIFFSIFHSISAFCNAGFDLIGDGKSLTPFVGDITINIAIWFLIIVGGLGFSVVIDIIQNRRFRDFSLHSKMVIVITVALIVIGTLGVFVLEVNNPNTLAAEGMGVKEKILGSIFHGITPRTAGFNSLPTDQLRNSTKFLTIVLMFIGGSPGSTAGGIKTATLGVLLFTVISIISGKEYTELFNRRVARETIQKTFTVATIALGVVILVTMLLTITEVGDFMDILFESISAFGTVGLSTGLTPNLSNIGRVIVILTMFIGRVGPLTLAVAVAQKQQKNKGLYKYPEERIIVG